MFAAPLFLLSLLGCLNECSFWARCNGNVVEICGSGVDQVVGRTIHSTDCGDAGTCVEIDEKEAFCATNPVTTCDGTFVATCDEANAGVTSCQSGYVTYTDCVEADLECNDASGEAMCDLPCDGSAPHCDVNGYGYYHCTDGFTDYTSCPSGQTCTEGADGPTCG